MKTTPEMRARIRELSVPERDDFDRAVLELLDDFEAVAHLSLTYDDGLRRAAEICMSRIGTVWHTTDGVKAGEEMRDALLAELSTATHLLHASDCAIYNEPAFPKGECDCGASAPQPSREEMLAALKEIVELEQERLTNSPMFAQRSVASIITILDRARAVIARADNAGKPEGEGGMSDDRVFSHPKATPSALIAELVAALDARKEKT